MMKNKTFRKIAYYTIHTVRYIKDVAVGASIAVIISFFVIGVAPTFDAMSMYSLARAFNENTYSTVKPKILENTNGQWITIALSQVDELYDLEPDRWESLDITEKLNVLQVISNIESTYLGLKTPVRVGAAKLGDTIQGSYSDSKKTAYISIDKLLVGESWSIVSTLLHEIKHSYQHECIAALEKAGDYSGLQMFNLARLYSESFSEYPYERESPEQKEAYFNNDAEISARNYAENYVHYFTLLTINTISP